MSKDKMKKAIYKKWWFWVIIVIILFALINSTSKDPDEENSNENQGAEVTQALDETEDESDTEDDINTDELDDTDDPSEEESDVNNSANTTDETALTRDNSSAALTTLNTGKFVAGTDIPVGRYVITGDGNGNLFINNEAGESYVNEILGGGDFGIKSVTTDITEGDTIEISGINNVTFTPAETVLYTDTLTTGSWVVGMDFPPGRYDISSTSGNGNLFVYDTTGWPEVNEILGGGDYGVEKVTANLKDGYKITISGMNEVKFVEK